MLDTSEPRDIDSARLIRIGLAARQRHQPRTPAACKEPLMPESNFTTRCIKCGQIPKPGSERCRRCAKKLKNRLRSERSTNRREKTKPLSYDERDAIIRSLGFESYKAYLQSDLWRSIRSRVYEKHGHKCYVCRKQGVFKVPATEVHHRRYTPQNLAGESIFGMFPVCRECHISVEFKDGRKVSTETSYRLFNRTTGLP